MADIKQAITDKIIAQIAAGTPKWRKPWVNGLNRNPATGTVYKPLNQIILMSEGYADPRWYSPKWCKDNGIGFKGAKMAFIAMYFDGGASSKHDDSDSEIVGQKSGHWRAMTQMGLFNAEKLQGLPSLAEELGLAEFTPDECIEQLADKVCQCTGLTINHGGQSACYEIATHNIKMPPKQFFKTPAGYYATLLHEMGHAMGHPSLENRQIQNKFGSDAYAFEELVAELTASQMLGLFRGMPSDECIGQHASYIQSWTRILKGDKEAIFAASKLANDACARMLAFVPELAENSGILPQAQSVIVPTLDAAPATKPLAFR